MWKPQKPVSCKEIITKTEKESDEKSLIKLYRFCDPPKIPEHGDVECKSGKCKFTCKDGYDLKGFPSKMCVNKKWKPEKDIFCEKVIVGSNEKPDKVVVPKKLNSGCIKPFLENGIVRCLRGGKSCQFVCNPGYLMIGSSQTYCNLSKKWSRPAPTCKIIENEKLEILEEDVMLKSSFKNKKYSFGNCKSLDIPKNGELNCAKNKCTFKCDEGYILEGYHTKICGK